MLIGADQGHPGAIKIAHFWHVYKIPLERDLVLRRSSNKCVAIVLPSRQEQQCKSITKMIEQ
jgi:hypothetical protein